MLLLLLSFYFIYLFLIIFLYGGTISAPPTIRHANKTYYYSLFLFFYVLDTMTNVIHMKDPILITITHNRLKISSHYHLNHLYDFNSGWMHLTSYGLDIHIRTKFDSSTADEEKSKLEQYKSCIAQKIIYQTMLVG